MLKGTRLLTGTDAFDYSSAITSLRRKLLELGYSEVIVPAIWNTSTFTEKLGPEKENQMWTFLDKGDRDCCLIPEVTGIIQEQWINHWWKNKATPHKIFYVSRCYRYERPQEGRYREFTQIGVEVLGGSPLRETLIGDLEACLNFFNLDYVVQSSVKRGLEYYVEDGFEVECSCLGAQKQIAGGGRYAEGIGWAIGLERMLLAIKKKENPNGRGIRL